MVLPMDTDCWRRALRDRLPRGMILVLALSAWLGSGAAGQAVTRYHVAAGGSDVNDGLAWSTALATISNAMTRVGDGDTVMLSNGTFTITAQINLTNAVVFTSTNGWQSTTVGCNTASVRGFFVSNENAVIDGVTITHYGTYGAADGCGVYMNAGRVQNCLLTNNYSANSGANVYMTGGTVSNCTLVKGRANAYYGGGVYISGGSAIVEYCTIRDNYSNREGGGVFMGPAGGTLRHCSITDNYTASREDGAIYMTVGLVENCLVARNRAANYYGRGIFSLAGAGEVRYCTVVDNESAGSSGGIWTSGGTVRNCIAYNNKLVTGAARDVVQTGGTITYSCSPDLTNGIGNTTGDPQFEDRAASDYRLAPGSAAIDAATNIAGVVVDRDGLPRPADGDGDGSADPDMGCYEAAAADAGTFRCDFTAPTNEADLSLNAQFTATVYGPQTNGLYYRWDYDGNGSVDEEGFDKPVVTHPYSPGSYPVSLTVSNSNNDVTTRLKPSYILVHAANTYVTTNGSHTTPFDSWGTAATNLQAAVDSVMEGGTVTVSNGTYLVNEHVAVLKGATVRSANGAAATIVKRDTATVRLFALTHSNAVVDGFTLVNGISPATLDRGGGVYMTAGTVRHCTVTNGAARVGGGICVEGGLVTNCTVIACRGDQGGNSQQGGGVYVSGGLVTDCEIVGCTTVRAGGGAYLGSGGELRGCVVRGNSGAGWGAAVVMEGGACMMRNCQVTGNLCSGTYYGGGGVYMNHAAARVVNSTICGNSAGDDGGGIKCLLGVVSNSIVYYNTITASGAADDFGGATGTNHVRFSCSPDLVNDPAGTGNITAEPGFTDRDNGDFSLAGGSPCIDAGAALADVVNDIEGTARPLDGDNDSVAIHDMGCYEAPDAGSGALGCNFSAPTNEAAISLNAVLTVIPSGGDTNNLYCWWDFDNNGSVDDEGYGKDTVSHLYSAGFYTVKLTVSNATGEVASKTQADYIKVYAAATYVTTNGPHTAPFDSWAMAATNIQNAVDRVMEGGTVWVSNGVYTVGGQVNLTRGVTVRSTGGADQAIVQRGTAVTRLFGLGHPDAVLDGFTLRNGYTASGQGGGVYMTGGTIMNCRITNGMAVYGGGIYMTRGMVSNCAVIQCTANDQAGGGIYLSGGLVIGSEIVSNYARRAANGVYMAGGELNACRLRNNTYSGLGWGAALWMDGACTTRNCLVTGNLGGDDTYGGGGGIRMNHAGARLVNCTVVGNDTLGSGGGIKLLAGSVTNCIVFYNSATMTDDNLYPSGSPKVGHSCSPDLVDDPSGTGNITGEPQFIEAGNGYGLSHVFGDYHLLQTSPCIDAGMEQPWMATGRDLGSGPRLLNATVDMGAYEIFMRPRGTLFCIQ